MNIQFRRAAIPGELRSLVTFDHKAFHEHPADWFAADDWKAYESWWMLGGKTKIGCCAFAPHVDFLEDLPPHTDNPGSRGTLYIVSTGILPAFRERGFGALLKQWQLTYARNHGFQRLVTNTRKSNRAMLELNRKFGFTILRTTPHYYQDPAESTVVMERLL